MTNSWQKLTFTDEVYRIPEDSPAPLHPETVETREEPKAAVSEQTVHPEAPPRPALSFKGKNLRNTVILVPAIPASEDLGLLENILKAVGQGMDDVALVVYDESQKNQIQEELNPERILCFGLKSDPWISSEAYTISTGDFARHLRVDALPIISADKSLKRKLWMNLQPLFDL